MSIKPKNSDEWRYRLRLIDELKQGACARGLYKTVKPPRKSNPNSEFSLVICDLMLLCDDLPVFKEGNSLEVLERRIRRTLLRCSSKLIGSMRPADVYSIMALALERAEEEREH